MSEKDYSILVTAVVRVPSSFEDWKATSAKVAGRFAESLRQEGMILESLDGDVFSTPPGGKYPELAEMLSDKLKRRST